MKHDFDITRLDWEKMQGLIPVIIQDATTYQVLMLGYMNQAALTQTLASPHVTFYSRSKQRLWVKGETSGHYLEWVDIIQDCDNDSLLILAHPKGPTCHLGTSTCFEPQSKNLWAILPQLEDIIQTRQRDKPEKSYTTTLFSAGVSRIAQKVGEEGVEVALAAVENKNEALCNEISDLIFHVMVLLTAKQLSLQDVLQVLDQRMHKSS